ncbi:hypothetical protein D3C87_1734270 [compost metagenome]
MADDVFDVRWAVVGDNGLAITPVSSDVVLAGLQCHGNLRLRGSHHESINLQIKINNKNELIRKTYRVARAEDHPITLFRAGRAAEKLSRRG